MIYTVEIYNSGRTVSRIYPSMERAIGSIKESLIGTDAMFNHYKNYDDIALDYADAGLGDKEYYIQDAVFSVRNTPEGRLIFEEHEDQAEMDAAESTYYIDYASRDCKSLHVLTFSGAERLCHVDRYTTGGNKGNLDGLKDLMKLHRE